MMEAVKNVAVAYARFSSEMLRGESIDAQLSAIKRYAAENGITIIEEYIDRAKSGTNSKRPAFLEMIKASKTGLFSLILIHKTDRFARSRYDSVIFKQELRANGVKVFSVTEQFDDTPSSVMHESIMESLGEYYSLNLAQEVLKGLYENAKKAKSTGGPPPFGYRIDPETKKLTLNEDEAEGVRMIFDMILKGHSYFEVITELNRRGFRTRGGKPFGTNSLHNLLKNEKYRGCFIYNKSASKDLLGKRNGHRYKAADDIIKIEDGCPRIISDTEFFLIQEKMSVRQQARNHANMKEDYLLRGKVYCTQCGSLYIGTRRKRGDGSYWAAYLCNQRSRQKGISCKAKEVSKTYLESIVLEKLAEYVFADSFIPVFVNDFNKYLQEHDSGRAELERLEKALAKNERSAKIATEALLETGSAALHEKLRELEKERCELEQRIFKLQRTNPAKHITVDELKEVFKDIRKRLMDGNLLNLKRVIEVYVNRIEVSDDMIVIRLNFFPNISVPLLCKGGATAPILKKARSSIGENPMEPLTMAIHSKNVGESGGEGGI